MEYPILSRHSVRVAFRRLSTQLCQPRRADEFRKADGRAQNVNDQHDLQGQEPGNYVALTFASHAVRPPPACQSSATWATTSKPMQPSSAAYSSGLKLAW
jgi:hypothetical protein